MNNDLERRLTESFQGARLPDAPDTLRAFLERLPLEAQVRPAASWLPVRWLAPALVALVTAALVFALMPHRTTAPASSPTPGVNLSSGITWRQVAGPGDVVVDGDVVMGVVAVGDGYLMVGEAGRGSSAVWWSSPDGQRWQRHDSDPVFADSLLQWVVPIPNGLLIVGTSNKLDADCPGGVFGCNPVFRLRMWSSSDGRSWQRLPDHALDVFGRAALGVVTAGPAGLVAFGSQEPAKGNGTPMVWTSTDGRTWSKAPQLYAAYPTAVVDDVAATANDFIAVGRAGEAGGPAATGAAWYSADGRTWHAATAEPNAELSLAKAGAEGAIARSFPKVGPDSIWTTSDGTGWAKVKDAPFTLVGDSPTFISDGSQILAIATASTGSVPPHGAWTSSNGRDWRAIPETGHPPYAATLGAIGPRGVVLVAIDLEPPLSPTSLWFGSFGALPSPTATEGRTFQLTFPADSGGPLAIAPLPVVLTDHSGLVLGLRQSSGSAGGPAETGPEWVTGVPGDPRTLVINWLGGACDDRASLNLDGSQTALTVSISTTVSSSGCRLIGIGRSVALDLNVAVRPDAVRVTRH